MTRSGGLQLLMCVVWAVAGVLNARSGQRYSPTTLVAGVVFAGLIFSWCHVYAEEHGAKASIGWSILAALVAPIGIPLYFFRLQSPLRAMFATFLAVVFFIVLLSVYALASYATKLVAP
jgi:drug/metabolite transporter (DMT)-like permease